MNSEEKEVMIRRYFNYYSYEEEAISFIIGEIHNEDDIIELLSSAARLNNSDSMFGLYHLYIAILYNDNLWLKYGEKIPSDYQWSSREVTRNAIETSTLFSCLSTSQLTIIENFLMNNCYHLNIIQLKSFDKINAPLRKIEEWMKFICGTIHANIKGKEKVKTDDIIKIINNVIRRLSKKREK